VLNTHEALYVLNVSDIIRCEADRNYTRFFLAEKKTILISGGLKEYEEMLSSHGFLRPHHSHLVNISFIDRLEKKEGGILILKDGSEVPVSIRKYPELVAMINRV
jgi:two-component system LytT family response regulator